MQGERWVEPAAPVAFPRHGPEVRVHLAVSCVNEIARERVLPALVRLPARRPLIRVDLRVRVIVRTLGGLFLTHDRANFRTGPGGHRRSPSGVKKRCMAVAGST